MISDVEFAFVLAGFFAVVVGGAYSAIDSLMSRRQRRGLTSAVVLSVVVGGLTFMAVIAGLVLTQFTNPLLAYTTVIMALFAMLISKDDEGNYASSRILNSVLDRVENRFDKVH